MYQLINILDLYLHFLSVLSTITLLIPSSLSNSFRLQTRQTWSLDDGFEWSSSSFIIIVRYQNCQVSNIKVQPLTNLIAIQDPEIRVIIVCHLGIQVLIIDSSDNDILCKHSSFSLHHWIIQKWYRYVNPSIYHKIFNILARDKGLTWNWLHLNKFPLLPLPNQTSV